MSADPTEVVWHQTSGSLELAWSDRARVLLEGATLRSACRCAGCERARRSGHPVGAAPSVRVVDLRPMGQGAVQICFSDGHDRGVYPWAHLRDIALEPVA